ncbi:MAG TPA: hypothetical protein ENH84_01135 [Phycisphaerae bacterium]|nr:hypothetical protein [Phycisphaerae bacterium]
MTDPNALNIRLTSLLKWVLLPVLVMTGFGVLPTWLLLGWVGVWGQLTAVAIVLCVMLGSGLVTVYYARQNAALASTAFLGSSILRLILCPGMVGLAWWITPLPSKPMGVWMVISYLACLGLESTWIVKALREEVLRKETNRRGEQEQEERA